jgi:hypothetical protein
VNQSFLCGLFIYVCLSLNCSQRDLNLSNIYKEGILLSEEKYKFDINRLPWPPKHNPIITIDSITIYPGLTFIELTTKELAPIRPVFLLKKNNHLMHLSAIARPSIENYLNFLSLIERKQMIDTAKIVSIYQRIISKMLFIEEEKVFVQRKDIKTLLFVSIRGDSILLDSVLRPIKVHAVKVERL